MGAASDARTLAGQLSGLDAPALAALLRARGSSQGWQDCFDAAEGMLEPASIDRALARLPRAAVRALHAAAGARIDPRPGSQRATLDALALLRADGTPFTAVAERIRDAVREHPDAVADVAVPDPERADAGQEAALAERAAAGVRAMADIVALCAQAPLAATAAGSVTAAQRRRLEEDGIVHSAAQLEDLVALAAAAGLLAIDAHEVLVADAGAWLAAPLPERWRRVALGWRADLPVALRTGDGGFLPPAGWAGAVPLDAQAPEHARALLRLARRWGLYGPDGEEPGWTRPLRDGDDPDAAALAAHLPAEITTVYLQADLTAIAPGPLRADLDLRLRSMTVRESAAQASVRRFTAQSVAAAIADGETAASLRAFLAELSLTGIPQPLDYLIEQAAARHGLVTVEDAGDGARVRSPDGALLRTIAVDQELRALGLASDGDGLVSRMPADAVRAMLADARYPVDAGGSVRTARAAHVRTAPTADAQAEALAARLLAHSGQDADAAWLERELEQAVRRRAQITVTVRLPDGTPRELTLEATGLGGGRLRGRDRAADIERTLPVRSILSVRAD